MRRGTHKRRACGLTLLELLIALAVLAVLGTLALPTLGTQVERSRLRDAAQTLAGDIAEARYLAAQRGQAVHLAATPGAQWCWTVSLQPGCHCGVASSCAVHTARAVTHPGTTLLAPLDMHFGPAGTPAMPGSAVFESPRGEQLRVDVSALGRPRICAVNGKQAQIPACTP